MKPEVQPSQPPSQPQLKTFGNVFLEPGAYTLDLSTVRDAPVKVNGQPSTYADTYRRLRDSKIGQMPKFLRDLYVTDEGEVNLEGDSHMLRTLRNLTELTRQGINPHDVAWFYYDHDLGQDGLESYDFFVVHADKVVMESCHFFRDDPVILKRKMDNEAIWGSHRYLDEAWERYWYCKFYTETMRGQLMVLRPDEPLLFYFQRPQTRDAMRDVQVVTLVKTYRLLWVAIALLVGIAFPAIRVYAAIAAIVLGLDVLWRWWATRKVGQS